MLYRRTYDGQGYSPLDQINTSNVKNLTPVWTFSTGVVEGHEAPPIVNNGVMFVATPMGQVIALNAKTGDEYLALQAPASRRSLPAASDQPRRRPVAGQALSRHHGRPCRRARRQDRQGGLGHQGAGLQEGPVPDPDAAGRRRQGHRRRLGRRVRRSRLCRRVRRQRRQGTVAHLHHSRRRRARPRHLAGRRLENRRRLGLDDRQLRQGHQDHLLGRRQRRALARRRRIPATISTPARCSRSIPTPARSRPITSTTRTIPGTGTRSKRRC